MTEPLTLRAVFPPACSTCNDSGEVYTEAQFGGVSAKVDPCPDCRAPRRSSTSATLRFADGRRVEFHDVRLTLGRPSGEPTSPALDPWSCDLSELPPVAPLQEMQPAWWATTTVPPLGKGCVLCGDGLGLRQLVLDPTLRAEPLCSRCRDYYRESMDAGRARFPEAGTAQDFRQWRDDSLIPAGLSDSHPHLPVYPESRNLPGLS